MTPQALDRKTAREIINQLKSGTTPLDATTYLDVGRDRWYRGMHYYFDSAEDGESKVRFIRGSYGDGKTHLMGMARHFALERGFAVSYTSAEVTRLDKIEEIYKAIVKNLVTLQIQGGLEFLLRDWRSKVELDIDLEAERLRSTAGLDINFRLAVEAYLREEDSRHQDTIVQWLYGEPRKLPELGINRYLRAGDSRDMMRSVSIFLRLIGYKGLLVLVDELDRVQNQTRRVRNDCYQVLRELMDNTDSHGGMQGTLFYCAAPGEMFISANGFSEYEALKSRIKPAVDAIEQITPGSVDYRATIINLESTHLQPDDFFTMATRVREIHSTALNWDAASTLPDDQLKTLVDQITKKDYNISTPRLVTTTVAIVTDMLEQGHAIENDSVIKMAYDIAEDARAKKHRKQYED